MGKNTELVDRHVNAFNDHDYNAIGATLADDVTYTDIPGGMVSKGRAEVIEYLKGWHAGFSNARITEPKYFESNGTVIFQFVGRGTQSAEFGPGPFPNKGGEFELRSIQVHTINDAGQITNVDLYYDTMTMLTQLGHMG
jgi:steroid delta-isomerase-like uncharacterized protein